MTRSEHSIQASFFSILRDYKRLEHYGILIKDSEGYLLSRLKVCEKIGHAIPNGAIGELGKRRGAFYKSEGAKKGVSDMFFPVHNRTRTKPGLYIELKTLKGSASKAQIEFKKWVESEGYEVALIKTDNPLGIFKTLVNYLLS